VLGLKAQNLYKVNGKLRYVISSAVDKDMERLSAMNRLMRSRLAVKEGAICHHHRDRDQLHVDWIKTTKIKKSLKNSTFNSKCTFTVH
jgi:hypothetical protein